MCKYSPIVSLANHARSRALTRGDVLATVAALALLLTVLLPALNAETGDRRDEVCLSNLRQLGIAVSLYNTMSNDALPGSLHPAVYRGFACANPPLPPTWTRRYLASKLREVIGDSITDRLVTCPVAAGINPDQNFQQFYSQTGRAVYPVHYAVNNYGPSESGGTTPTPRPTNPPYYFGFSAPDLPDDRLPSQRLGAIANPAREWMIADAWYRDRANPAFPDYQQEGPYQTAWSGEAMPHFAPHNARVKSYRFSDSATRATEAAQIRAARLDGETNTLYFDGHAAAAPSRTLVINGFELLYGFRGTVNPYAADPQMSAAVWR